MGYTGHEGRWPDDEQIDRWAQELAPLSNLALRVDYGIVGIDVDAYDGKTGGLTLKQAEVGLGSPACYVSFVVAHRR